MKALLLVAALVFAAACGDALAPLSSTDCPAGKQYWSYSETSQQGVAVADVHGCAAPSELASIQASCMSGRACPPVAVAPAYILDEGDELPPPPPLACDPTFYHVSPLILRNDCGEYIYLQKPPPTL